MENFEMKKFKEANIYKSITFPLVLDDNINDIVDKAIEELEIKKYSFNGFVILACEFAIKNMKNIKKDNK